MKFFCKVCDISIIENESEYKNYIATVREKDDKSFLKKYTMNNINLDEVNIKLNDYNSTHNNNFDF